MLIQGPTRTGWTKRFIDGTVEHGSDEDVAAGRASWSKGRLKGIKEVTLYFGNDARTLQSQNGAATFHQSDDYEAAPGQPSRLTCRRIQMCISNLERTYWAGDISEGTGCFEECYIAPEDKPHVLWATIEVDVTTGEWKSYNCLKRK